MSRKDKIWLKVRTKDLARLLGVNKRTLLRWIKLKKFDPRDIMNIINKYNDINHLQKEKDNAPQSINQQVYS